MKVKVSHAIYICLFFLITAASSVYLSERQREYRPAVYLQAEAQQLSVVVGGDILRFDRSGYRDSIALGRLGITKLIGDLAYFDNGDLLLRSSVQSSDVSDGFSKGLLLRCSVNVGEKLCQQFSDSIELSEIYHSVILPDNQVIIADALNDQLLWLDAEGQEVDRIKQDLNHPNDIALDGDDLVIAHTNERELLIVPLLSKGFSEKQAWRHLKIDFDATVNSGTQPTALVVLGDAYLLLLQDSLLSSWRLFLVNKQGEFIREFSLPSGADLFSLALFDETIYVSDFFALDIYRYNLQGDFLGKLNDSHWLLLSDGMKERSEQYRYFRYFVLGLAGLVFLVLFVVALKKDRAYRSAQKNIKKVDHNEILMDIELGAKPDIDDKTIIWIEKKRWLKYLGFSFAVLMSLLVFLLVFVFIDLFLRMEEDADIGVLLAFISLILLPYFIWRIFRKGSCIRLGVSDSWLIAVDSKGRVAIEPIVDCYVMNKTALLVGDVYLLLGQGMQSMFDQRMMKKNIIPLLDSAKEISFFEFYKKRWEMKHVEVRVYIPLALLVVIIKLCVDYILS